LDGQTPHTGFAFSEENNPNPKLFEQVRRGTLIRLSQAKQQREIIED
jgi:hypothetical protein